MPNLSYPRTQADPRSRSHLSPLALPSQRRVHPPPVRRSPLRDRPRRAHPALPRATRGAGRKQSMLITELGSNVLTESLDPRNATLEPEYYGDVDPDQYGIRKPLIWFWQMFDRSPVGLNHWLGFRFRCMLGRHIFKHLGKGVKIFHNVEFTFGYKPHHRGQLHHPQERPAPTTAARSSFTKAPASPTTPTSTPTPTTSTNRPTSPTRSPSWAHTPASPTTARFWPAPA